MAYDTERRPEASKDPAGEWLELGEQRPRRPAPRWLRPALIVLGGMIVLAMITAIMVVARPGWIARQSTLTLEQVRTALSTLALDDRRLRSVTVDPQSGGGPDACAVLRGLVDVDGPEGLPSVELTGRVPNDRARVTVAGVVFPNPAAAADHFDKVQGALRNPLCLESADLGRLVVDAGPQPDRRLGYLIGVPSGGNGSGDTWWYRARVLRFGNTINYVSSFGPTGAADVTTDLTDGLDRAYADLA